MSGQAEHSSCRLKAAAIIPAAGATQTLPRAIGRARSLEALLTSGWIDAAEAQRMGLVNRVVPRAELFPLSERIAKRFVSRHPEVIRTIKEAIRSGASLSLAAGLDRERYLCATLFARPVAKG